MEKLSLNCIEEGKGSYNFIKASYLVTKLFKIIFIPITSSLSNFKVKSLKNGELSFSAIKLFIPLVKDVLFILLAIILNSLLEDDISLTLNTFPFNILGLKTDNLIIYLPTSKPLSFKAD